MDYEIGWHHRNDENNYFDEKEYSRVSSKFYAEYYRDNGGDVVKEVYYPTMRNPDVYFSVDQDDTYEISPDEYKKLVEANTFFMNEKDENGWNETVTFFYARYNPALYYEKDIRALWDARENDELQTWELDTDLPY